MCNLDFSYASPLGTLLCKTDDFHETQAFQIISQYISDYRISIIIIFVGEMREQPWGKWYWMYECAMCWFKGGVRREKGGQGNG